MQQKREEFNFLIKSEHVQKAIREYMDRNDESYEKAVKKGYEYFFEMRNEKSYIVSRLAYRITKFIAKKFFNNVTLSNGHINRNLIKKGHNVIYTFNHLSVLDGLFITYAIVENDFKDGETELHFPIILGSLNANFWPLSSFLRRTNLIFIRRFFKDNIFYSALLESYLVMMLNRGHHFILFSEGVVSTTGHLLPMKTGIMKILSKISDRLENPIAFIPGAISYDRIVGLESYLPYLSQDHMKGQYKSQGSISKLFQGIYNFFKKKYGNIYLNMTEPVLLKKGVGLNDTYIDDLACEIKERQKKSTYVGPMHIFATVLLEKNSIHADELLKISQRINQFFISLPMCNDNIFPEDNFINHLDACSSLDLFDWNRDSNIVSASELGLILMRYHRNNISHLFEIPSKIAKVILKSKETAAIVFNEMLDKEMKTILKIMEEHDFISLNGSIINYTYENEVILKILASALYESKE